MHMTHTPSSVFGLWTLNITSCVMKERCRCLPTVAPQQRELHQQSFNAESFKRSCATCFKTRMHSDTC